MLQIDGNTLVTLLHLCTCLVSLSVSCSPCTGAPPTQKTQQYQCSPLHPMQPVNTLCVTVNVMSYERCILCMIRPHWPQERHFVEQ